MHSIVLHTMKYVCEPLVHSFVPDFHFGTGAHFQHSLNACVRRLYVCVREWIIQLHGYVNWWKRHFAATSAPSRARVYTILVHCRTFFIGQQMLNNLSHSPIWPVSTPECHMHYATMQTSMRSMAQWHDDGTFTEIAKFYQPPNVGRPSTNGYKLNIFRVFFFGRSGYQQQTNHSHHCNVNHKRK